MFIENVKSGFSLVFSWIFDIVKQIQRNAASSMCTLPLKSPTILTTLPNYKQSLNVLDIINFTIQSFWYFVACFDVIAVNL